MTKSPGLHRVPEADLVRLLKAVSREQMPLPITRAGLLLAQFASIEAHLDSLVGQSKQAAIALLAAIVRERRQRPSHAVSLAWDGPAPSGAGSRPPRDVLVELIATAHQSVLFSGVVLERDRALLRSLHAAMQGRNLEVRVVLAAVDPLERASLGALVRELFHDPAFCGTFYVPDSKRVRGAMPFCMLVDHRRGFLLAGAPPEVESDDRCITAGFLIDHADTVVALEAQWQTLVHTTALLLLDATPLDATQLR
jgi:hypothetical protein